MSNTDIVHKKKKNFYYGVSMLYGWGSLFFDADNLLVNDRSNNNIDNLHYVAYRADILEKNPIKRQRVIIKQCICGSDITSNNFNTHLKSRKHQNYNSSE